MFTPGNQLFHVHVWFICVLKALGNTLEALVESELMKQSGAS